MTWIRLVGILSAAKDLYNMYLDCAEQKYSCRACETHMFL